MLFHIQSIQLKAGRTLVLGPVEDTTRNVPDQRARTFALNDLGNLYNRNVFTFFFNSSFEKVHFHNVVSGGKFV